jgi:hypothetical protein
VGEDGRVDVIDEALVTMAGGALALVERALDDRGGVRDRVIVRDTRTVDDAELDAILAL